MDEKSILAMKPGMDLDIEVAREVMDHKVIKDENLGYLERFVSAKDGGSVWEAIQPYSQDMAAAELVIEKMKEQGQTDAASWADFGGGAYSEPEAVAKAALIAVLKIKRSAAADRIIRMALEDET
jgi:hypothetical protein